jgi:gliding motility-associated-like protein
MKNPVRQSLLIGVIFHFICSQTFGLTASFTYIKRNHCAPTVVVFTNTSSSGSDITYIWDFGLGAQVTTSDNSGKEQIYTTPGQYTVKLTVKQGSNSVTTSSVITIGQAPTANFKTSTADGCAPLTVKFTSTSSAGDAAISDISWDFRNGDYASGASSQYTYTDAGKYNVLMKVTDSNGCYSLLESDSLIQVVDKPIVNFKASDTFACEPPLNVSFKNLSSGATYLTYLWNFGNGTTSTELSQSSAYKSSGSYNVTLTATDQYGCSGTLTKSSYIKIGSQTGSIIVYDSNDSLVTKSKLCSGSYTFVCSLSSLPNYTWTIIDNGKNITQTGNNSITYTVSDTGKLIVNLTYGDNSSCSNAIQDTFIKSAVNANFTMDISQFCALPQKVNFKNSSTNAANSSWYLSNTLFSNQSDAFYTVTKNDLSATYEQLYSHVVNTTNLPVKLVVINSDGCADSITQNITLTFPVARFMPDKASGCVPLQVTFSDSSRSAYEIDEYVYSIGNKIISSSNQSIITYTFSTPGEYSVTEIIKSGGCYDTSNVVKVVVGDKLKPDITVTPTEICNGDTLHVSASTNNNALVDTWHLISSGIFDLSSDVVPDTSFIVSTDSSGNKNISLQVEYNGCLSDTFKSDAYKIKGPTGSFTQTFVCDSPLNYKFKSNLTPFTSLTWTVDTASFYNKDSIEYQFKKSGDYNVKLVAEDATSGCALSRTQTVKVRQITADYSLTDTIFCVGDSVKLNASSSVDFINSCYNEAFLWDFGDESALRRTYSQTYSYVYNKRGTYDLRLIAMADNGCVDTIQKTVHIYKPEGSFIADTTSGCAPSFNVKFTNTSADSSIVKWVWNFGDNSIDSSKVNSVTHIYSDNVQKTFNASLAVYDAYQCYSNYSLPITLNVVKSDFQADDNAICAGQIVAFTPIDEALDNLFWTFGDGSNSSSSNVHTYNLKGNYTVSLAASKNGCRDTVTKPYYVSVEQAISRFFVSDSTLTCYPDTVLFVHDSKVGSTATLLTWMLNSKDLANHSDSIKYVFTTPATYTAQLTVNTLNGCQSSSSKSISVSGPVGSFSFYPKKICYNEGVTFTLDSINDVTEWRWQFGDGDTSSVNPATHYYTSKGKIVPSLLLISKSCTYTQIGDTLTISSVQANFSANGDSSLVCSDNTIDLTNTSTDSKSWAWYLNNALISNDFSLEDVSLSRIGDNYLTLIVKGDDNCTDTLSKTYTMVKAPSFTISGDSTICQGQKSVNLSVTPESGWTISWKPASSIDNSSAFSIIATPSSSTVYVAVVTNTQGCTASSEKKVKINEALSYTRTPVSDTTIRLGEQIQLIIIPETSNVTYSWSPNYNISCLNCNNPYVSPQKDVTYTVTATDNCFSFTDSFNIKIITDFYLEAPTAFSPNGDGNNEIFTFEANNIKSFDLKIFNRWGGMVFTTNDLTKGWDGSVNGRIQNIDTYTYIVKAETNNGYKFEKKGNFLLLK